MLDIYAFLRGRVEEVDKFLKGMPAKVEKQTLKEHVSKALKALDEMRDSKIWRYAVKIFEGDEDLMNEHLRLIILFHDIGKVFYQANFRFDEKRGLKYLNFKGHEYFSTYLADEYLWRSNISYKGVDRETILSTILYHHHAMGLKDRGKVRELRVCKDREEYGGMCKALGEILEKHGLLVSDFLQYLRNLGSHLKRKGRLLVLKEEFTNDVYMEVNEINRDIWSNFIRNKKFRRKMLVLNVILQVCDYRGSVGRTRRPPKFYDVLKEFINLYR